MSNDRIPKTNATDVSCNAVSNDKCQAEYIFTAEQLVGRNFYHYTGGRKDEKQPAAYAFPDLEIYEVEAACVSAEKHKEAEKSAEADDDEFGGEYEEIYGEEEDDEDEEEVVVEAFGELIPADCWVKRLVGIDNYLLYLVTDSSGKVTDCGYADVTFSCTLFECVSIPLSEWTLSGEDKTKLPSKIMEELRMLLAGRFLPLDFSFVGKRLPQKMIDEGGNGGSNEEYTDAIQSAYRSPYMHITIETTEDGVVKEFEYATYKSSDCGCWGMFSRPEYASDREDEAVDMLLYIYDMYTDEELSQF